MVVGWSSLQKYECPWGKFNKYVQSRNGQYRCWKPSTSEGYVALGRYSCCSSSLLSGLAVPSEDQHIGARMVCENTECTFIDTFIYTIMYVYMYYVYI